MARRTKVLAALVVLGLAALAAPDRGADQSSFAASPTASSPAEEAPSPLTWVRPPDPFAGSELDLCVDRDAILAGLDGGVLAAERRRLGVNCASPADRSSNRFVVLDYDGEPVFPAMRQQEGVPLTAEDAGVVPVPLGSVLNSASLLPRSADRELTVVRRSVALRHGVLRGLLWNGTAHARTEVTVTASLSNVELGSTTIGFVVQSGELAPFEIPIGSVPGPLDLVVAAGGTPSPSATLSRALMLTQAPGFWAGGPAEYPGVAPLPDSLVGQESIGYYETVVEPTVPSDAPEASAVLADAGILDVRAVAALLDQRQRVIDVIDTEVWDSKGRAPLPAATALRLGDHALIGVPLTAGADDVALWVFGASE